MSTGQPRGFLRLCARHCALRRTGARNVSWGLAAEARGGVATGVPCRAVASRPAPLVGGTDERGAAVDFRLARNAVLNEVRRGRLRPVDVCDAHPELLRAAKHIGRPTGETCQVCAEAALVHVTYVFGPRLPAQGRCVDTTAEMRRLDRRADDLACYVVEVCPACSWNHLVRRVPIGGRRAAR